MKEKKFYIPGIIIPAVGFAANLIMGSAVMGLVVAAISIFMNLRNRETYRVKIGIVLTVFILIEIIFHICIILALHSISPMQSTNALIMQILFGIAHYE